MTSSRAARSRAAPTTRRRSRRTERTPKLNDVVDIWWAVDKTFYRGRLHQQLHNHTSFRILYDDGEKEDIDLVDEYWKFADDDKPPPPDSDQIVDVVLDGSDQHSLQQSKPQSTSKKPKSKSSKSSTARPKSNNSSDDERDEDYVEEEEQPEPNIKQKRTKSDSDKPKKRPKKTRKQSTTSDKISPASRPTPKTSSESRQPPQSRSDQLHSTSHLKPLANALPNQQVSDANSALQKNVIPAQTDSRHTLIFRDGTNALQKNKNDTQIVDVTPSPPPAPNTRPAFHTETPHMAKSQNIPKPGKTKTAATEIVKPRTTTNSTSQLPTTTPSTGSQRVTDTVATSPQVATVPHAHIDSQRDLAIIQAQPYLLPSDRPSLPPTSSDPAAAGRHTAINKDVEMSFTPYNQVTPGPHPSTPASAAAKPVNKKTAGGEMVHDIPADEEPSPESVPTKVATRAKSHQKNLSGSGLSNTIRVHGEASTDHSDGTGGTAVPDDGAIRKRTREDGDFADNAAEARANGDVRPKRSKTSGTAEGESSLQPDGENTLTHFPEHDPTLATLVNRRLNPIERHIRSLSEDMHLLASNVQGQRKVNDTITGTLQRVEQDIRKEVRAIQNELRSAQADRQEKQQEILKLLREMKEGLSRAPVSHPAGHAVGGLPVQRTNPPNGYNIRSPDYQRTTATPARPVTSRPVTSRPVTSRPVASRPVASGAPQIPERRVPVQDARPVRVPPSRNPVGIPGTLNSDDDVNVSPRRIAAPMPTAVRGPGDMNANKVNQLASGPKFRITSVVARQITVWLLETPHEYDHSEGVALDLWARRTSAGAFERVADRLSHFDSYAQAYQTLSTSLGNDAVEMSWFMSPEDRANVMRARRNYAAWDPPPTDSEWESECVLLTEIANGFHRALENHIWRNEDDLTAAVLITKNAAASYGLARAVAMRQPNNGIHVAVSQAHRTGQATHHNGAQFIRTPR